MLTSKSRSRWVWYASKSERPVILDARRYPAIEYDGKTLPRPAWICQGENGGLHVDGSVGRIDIDVVSSPVPTMEINWTEPFALNIAHTTWIELWRDLADPARVFFGKLRVDDQEIDDWVAIHGLNQPALKSAAMTERRCNRCGNVSTWTKGREYFDAPHIGDQKVLVNGNGIYLRDDVVRERAIRSPAGGFELSYVSWKIG